MASDESASAAICSLLDSLHDLTSLRKVSLYIAALEVTPEETLAELEEDRDLISAIEEALIKLPKLKKVAVELIRVDIPTFVLPWHPDFIREHGPRLLPALHERKLLAIGETRLQAQIRATARFR